MKKIYLFEHFTSNKPIFVGTIFIDNTRGKDIYSFQYDDEYLKNPSIKVNFDPDISLYKGLQYPNNPTGMFMFLSDLMPDRWGKLLLQHNFKANKINKTLLQNSDYLLYVNDLTRMGGFRLSLDKNTFISSDSNLSIPHYIYLNKIEQAAIEFSKNKEVQKWLQELMYAGSSLGGARPKANIYDDNKNLYIAKFPASTDEYDVEAFEAVCCEIAKLLDIDIPEFKTEILSKYGTTFLTKRFDRCLDKRLHYQSCLTLLKKEDGDKGYYLDIVSIIRSYSKNINYELKELFKRIAFYIAINNTDNHLRNISFIIEGSQMKLSPCYDINPCPYKSVFATSFNDDGNDNFNEAIKNAKYFNLNENEAREIINRTIKIISDNYFKLCDKYKINKSVTEEMFKIFNLEI